MSRSHAYNQHHQSTAVTPGASPIAAAIPTISTPSNHMNPMYPAPPASSSQHNNRQHHNNNHHNNTSHHYNTNSHPHHNQQQQQQQTSHYQYHALNNHNNHHNNHHNHPPHHHQHPPPPPHPTWIIPQVTSNNLNSLFCSAATNGNNSGLISPLASSTPSSSLINNSNNNTNASINISNNAYLNNNTNNGSGSTNGASSSASPGLGITQGSSTNHLTNLLNAQHHYLTNTSPIGAAVGPSGTINFNNIAAQIVSPSSSSSSATTPGSSASLASTLVGSAANSTSASTSSSYSHSASHSIGSNNHQTFNFIHSSNSSNNLHGNMNNPRFIAGQNNHHYQGSSSNYSSRSSNYPNNRGMRGINLNFNHPDFNHPRRYQTNNGGGYNSPPIMSFAGGYLHSSNHRHHSNADINLLSELNSVRSQYNHNSFHKTNSLSNNKQSSSHRTFNHPAFITESDILATYPCNMKFNIKGMENIRLDNEPNNGKLLKELNSSSIPKSEKISTQYDSSNNSSELTIKITTSSASTAPQDEDNIIIKQSSLSSIDHIEEEQLLFNDNEIMMDVEKTREENSLSGTVTEEDDFLDESIELEMDSSKHLKKSNVPSTQSLAQVNSSSSPNKLQPSPHYHNPGPQYTPSASYSFPGYLSGQIAAPSFPLNCPPIPNAASGSSNTNIFAAYLASLQQQQHHHQQQHQQHPQHQHPQHVLQCHHGSHHHNILNTQKCPTNITTIPPQANANTSANLTSTMAYHHHLQQQHSQLHHQNPIHCNQRNLDPSNNSYHELCSNKLWQYYITNRQTEVMYVRKVQLRNALHMVMSYVFENAGLFIVGSSMNGFGGDNSDMDLCLTISSKELDQKKEAFVVLHQLVEPLRKCSFIKNLQLIRATVPILKFRDSLAGVDCDLNINNVVGIYNTHLMAMYNRIDWRVRPLGMYIKHWAQKLDIHDASRGRLSTYTLILMVIHYLQAGCQPAVLPSLQMKFPKQFSYERQVKEVDMRLELPWDELRSNNNARLSDLLMGFFEYYSEKFDFTRMVVSVRQGKPLPIDVAIQQLPPHEQLHNVKSFKMFIEEPFSLTNVARSLFDGLVFSRIKRAFRHSLQVMRMKHSLKNIFNMPPMPQEPNTTGETELISESCISCCSSSSSINAMDTSQSTGTSTPTATLALSNNTQSSSTGIGAIGVIKSLSLAPTLSCLSADSSSSSSCQSPNNLTDITINQSSHEANTQQFTGEADHEGDNNNNDDDHNVLDIKQNSCPVSFNLDSSSTKVEEQIEKDLIKNNSSNKTNQSEVDEYHNIDQYLTSSQCADSSSLPTNSNIQFQ